jgi:ankyrin repeat protein
MKVLLELGAQVNFRDENGWTPLALVLEHSDWIYLVSTLTKNLDLISLLLAPRKH